MLSTSQVQKLVEDHLPDAKVRVTDLTGTSDHFGVDVISTAFEGKSLIDQHKIVHAACAAHMGGAIHALQIKTRVPE